MQMYKNILFSFHVQITWPSAIFWLSDVVDRSIQQQSVICADQTFAAVILIIVNHVFYYYYYHLVIFHYQCYLSAIDLWKHWLNVHAYCTSVYPNYRLWVTIPKQYTDSFHWLLYTVRITHIYILLLEVHKHCTVSRNMWIAKIPGKLS